MLRVEDAQRAEVFLSLLDQPIEGDVIGGHGGTVLPPLLKATRWFGVFDRLIVRVVDSAENSVDNGLYL
jgi:hypothetical protein